MKKLLIGMLPFAGLVGCATPSYNSNCTKLK